MFMSMSSTLAIFLKKNATFEKSTPGEEITEPKQIVQKSIPQQKTNIASSQSDRIFWKNYVRWDLVVLAWPMLDQPIHHIDWQTNLISWIGRL